MNSRATLPRSRVISLTISEDNLNSHLIIALEAWFKNIKVLYADETLTNIKINQRVPNGKSNDFLLDLEIEREMEVTTIKYNAS